MAQEALQDLVAPDGVCFGCGPKNPDGIQIKSYWADDGRHIITSVRPRACFTGWPGLVYGGFLAMLVDCHSNWAAIGNQYKAEGREPGSGPKINCVTGNLGVKYIKPTPFGEMLNLRAYVEGDVGRKTRIVCEIYAGDVLTAIGDSVFVRADTAQLAKQAHGQQG